MYIEQLTAEQMVRLYEHHAGGPGHFFEAGIDRLETLPGGWKDRVTTIALWPNEAIRIWPDDAGHGEPREYYWDEGRARAQGGSKLKGEVGSEVLVIELHRNHEEYEFYGRGGGWNDVVNSFHTFRTDGNVAWPERVHWDTNTLPGQNQPPQGGPVGGAGGEGAGGDNMGIGASIASAIASVQEKVRAAREQVGEGKTILTKDGMSIGASIASAVSSLQEKVVAAQEQVSGGQTDSYGETFGAVQGLEPDTTGSANTVAPSSGPLGLSQEELLLAGGGGLLLLLLLLL